MCFFFVVVVVVVVVGVVVGVVVVVAYVGYIFPFQYHQTMHVVSDLYLLPGLPLCWWRNRSGVKSDSVEGCWWKRK